ncbi:MAG: hypothetical protein N2Z85_01825 [Patescibacteria group bacterium]|nr:hypothetical protein [Patescibacteria group bacterium]
MDNYTLIKLASKASLFRTLTNSLKRSGYAKGKTRQIVKDVSTYVTEMNKFNKELSTAKSIAEKRKVIKKFSRGPLGRVMRNINKHLISSNQKGLIDYMPGKLPLEKTFKESFFGIKTKTPKSTKSKSVLNRIRSLIRNNPLTSAGVGLGTGAATGFLVNRGRQSEF